MLSLKPRILSASRLTWMLCSLFVHAGWGDQELQHKGDELVLQNMRAGPEAKYCNMRKTRISSSATYFLIQTYLHHLFSLCPRSVKWYFYITVSVRIWYEVAHWQGTWKYFWIYDNSTLPISHLKHSEMNDSRECYSGSDSQKTEESTPSRTEFSSVSVSFKGFIYHSDSIWKAVFENYKHLSTE